MAEIKKTPQSTYTGQVVVDPLTRIEGHLRIEVEVENGKIKDARSSATLFRGLEMILKGRDPLDAQHFTQRACGVCTLTHAMASVRAVDAAIGVKIPKNATLIRNIVLGAQMMHDHIVHFYGLHALDFVDVTSALKADPAAAAKLASDLSPSRPTKTEDMKAVQAALKKFVESGQLGPFTNAYFLGGHEAYYLPPEVNLIATAHYLEALRLQVKAARATAVFGGKNPHPQFLVAGGVSCYEALTDKAIAEFTALYKETKDFIDQVYIPDLLAVASFYKDWAAYGGTQNFIACGEYPTDESNLDSRYMPQGVIWKRDIAHVENMSPDKITEHVRHSWYEGAEARHPYKGVTEPKFTKPIGDDRYSWSKAPRYDSKATETGPLAQVLVAYGRGHKDVKPVVDMVLGKLGVGPEALFSTLGRTAARGIHAVVVSNYVETMLNTYKENVARGDKKIVEDYMMPKEAEGVGFVNAPRGMLSHWIRIENSRIGNFQLVVPTTWNFGPRCANEIMGPIEEALIGTPIADPKRPVEILRTVHSFDPCLACAVHVIDPKSNEEHVFQVL